MASGYTENFGLCQWEGGDQVVRSDFNGDNAKIEQALTQLTNQVEEKASQTALSQLASQVQVKGNCQMVMGSYVGNGLLGETNARTLTFDAKPLVLLIAGNSTFLAVCPGEIGRIANSSASSERCPVIWGEKSVSWYNNENAYNCMNEENTAYHYVALLDAGQ